MSWQSVAIEVGIEVGLYLANKYLWPPDPPPKPHTLDNISLPRVEEGTPIPIVYGRIRVRSSILAFSGPLQNAQVMAHGNWVTIYALDMLYIVGLPMGTAGYNASNSLANAAPRLWNVWIGDQKLSPPSLGHVPAMYSVIKHRCQVFMPDANGGEGQGGGFIGSYQWWGGWTDQNFFSSPNPIGDAFIGNVDTTLVPGYRRMMLVGLAYMPVDNSDPYFAATMQDPDAFNKYGSSGELEWHHPRFGFTLGENPDVNDISFEVSTFGDQLFSMTNPGFDFGGDADPIEVIYDLLTNPFGRIGLDTSKIDNTSFAAASATLKAEGHGYSNVFYSKRNAHQAIQEVTDQINAAIWYEPTDDKIHVKLIRNDYDPATIPAFDDTNIIDCNFVVNSWTNAVGEVRVSFTDRSAAYATSVAIARSPAATTVNADRRYSRDVSYVGCTNSTLASQLAQRDLAMYSVPLAKIKITTNRDGFRIRPGSVFKVSYAEYGIVNRVFRAARVDLGQLHDNKIVIDAVEDVFSSSYVGQTTIVTTTEPARPYPLTSRHVTEAPRLLAMQAFDSGVVADPDVAHILPLPVSNFSADATFFMRSRQLGSTTDQGALSFNATLDLPASDFPPTFTVATDYARELEPYDTTTGLVIENLVAPFGLTSATVAQIAFLGKHLILLLTPSGQEELIAFETSTVLGGGQYRLNNVWRGLLDRSALKIPAGSRGWFLDANMVGRKGWTKDKAVQLQLIPQNANNISSGGDAIDQYAGSSGIVTVGAGYPNALAMRPLPVADMGIAGEGCRGVIGLPGTAGRFKSISFLDEGVDLFGKYRTRLDVGVHRGDDAAQTNNIGTVLALTATFAGALLDTATLVGNPPPNTSNTLWCWGDDTVAVAGAIMGVQKIDGFGSIDLICYSLDQIEWNDPRLGKGGMKELDLLYALNPPRVTAFAPSWRNLLANVRWNYQNGGDVQSWNGMAVSAGTPSIASGSTSLSRAASGPGSYYLTAASASLVRAQWASVRRWNPRGLTAIGVCYVRNTNGDTTDTAQVTITARDATGLPGAVLTSASSAAAAGATGSWTRVQQSLTLPALTASADIKLTATEVAGGGTANADVAFTEPELRVGQFQANVLANYSFETGPGIGSWTLDSGAISAAALIASPSANYAICTAVGTQSQIHQDYTLPAGWEYGAQAFVTCFRASRIGGANAAAVTIQALDVSNNVLASGTTGAETMPAIDTWYKRTVSCDVPEGSTKIRVIFG